MGEGGGECSFGTVKKGNIGAKEIDVVGVFDFVWKIDIGMGTMRHPTGAWATEIAKCGLKVDNEEDRGEAVALRCSERCWKEGRLGVAEADGQ